MLWRACTCISMASGRHLWASANASAACRGTLPGTGAALAIAEQAKPKNMTVAATPIAARLFNIPFIETALPDLDADNQLEKLHSSIQAGLSLSVLLGEHCHSRTRSRIPAAVLQGRRERYRRSFCRLWCRHRRS